MLKKLLIYVCLVLTFSCSKKDTLSYEESLKKIKSEYHEDSHLVIDRCMEESPEYQEEQRVKKYFEKYCAPMVRLGWHHVYASNKIAAIGWGTSDFLDKFVVGYNTNQKEKVNLKQVWKLLAPNNSEYWDQKSKKASSLNKYSFQLTYKKGCVRGYEALRRYGKINLPTRDEALKKYCKHRNAIPRKVYRYDLFSFTLLNGCPLVRDYRIYLLKNLYIRWCIDPDADNRQHLMSIFGSY